MGLRLREQVQDSYFKRFEVLDPEPRSLQPQELAFLDGVLRPLLSLLLLRDRLLLKSRVSC